MVGYHSYRKWKIDRKHAHKWNQNCNLCLWNELNKPKILKVNKLIRPWNEVVRFQWLIKNWEKTI